ncbi:MAG TPA: VWA domain-containing protein [Planctomycetota bacterium]
MAADRAVVLAMSLTHAAHLWWLLLLPLLYWLALPPRPRQQAWTAHLVQWQLAQRALRQKPPRLSGLRFLLLALACAAAVMAHAGPVWLGTPGPTRLVVLLDASASMAARDGDRSAFDAATAAVRQQVAALPEHVEVTVLRCGGDLVRRHGPSARALHDVGRPSGALAVDLEQLAAAATRADTVVWTLTDGQGQTRLPSKGALTCVGRPGPNAAIVAVRTVDRWPLPGFGVALDVVSCTGGARTGEVRVTGAVHDEPPLSIELEPRTVQTVSLDLERLAKGGPLEVRLHVAGDVLPDDDVWQVELPPLPAPRIAVLADAEAGPYAKVAAETLAQEVEGKVVKAAAGAEVGLLLVDGGAMALVPGRTRAICFGSQFDQRAPVPWLEPQFADWDRGGALTAGLDLSELRVHCAFRETLPQGQPFLWAEEPGQGRVPLAVVAGDENLASVHFGFRLQDSNLPLLPAFPQLLRRAFVRSYGAAAKLQVRSPAVAAGEQDLEARVAGADRPLPPFGTPDREMGAWSLLLGLVALALRGFLR